MTVIVLFTRKGQSYRMRLSRIHEHPGECDRFEVVDVKFNGKDMMGQIVWTPVPDDSLVVPSGEWLVRRALWHLLESGARSSGPDLEVIDLGELEA